MLIENKEIGYDKPTFIIAEAGLNHNGNLQIAKQLVDVAVKAKVDAVKFQTFKESELSFKNITYKETSELKKYCDNKNIIFLSTPHTLSAINFLYPLVSAYKISSGHIRNDDFVKRIARRKKPIIASTGSTEHNSGVATKKEINHFLLSVGCKNLVLLYCISHYPCNRFLIKDFNKFMIDYSHIHVGISCHSPDIEYVLEAVKAGACMVEKHITIDSDFDCPDKNISISPDKLNELVEEIRGIEGIK